MMLMSLYMGVSRICEAMGAGVWEGDNNSHVGPWEIIYYIKQKIHCEKLASFNNPSHYLVFRSFQTLSLIKTVILQYFQNNVHHINE